MITKTPDWKVAFTVVIIGTSILVILLSLPRINIADVLEAFHKVGLPLIGIFAIIGWGTYFRMWAIKTFGTAWGSALTLLPILAILTFAFALGFR